MAIPAKMMKASELVFEALLAFGEAFGWMMEETKIAIFITMTTIANIFGMLTMCWALFQALLIYYFITSQAIKLGKGTINISILPMRSLKPR